MYDIHNLKESLLDEYHYADDPLLKDLLHPWDRMHIGAMTGYGRSVSNFGLQMMAHQNRVSKDGADFLRYLGYSERAAENFRAAMLFHDMGKTHSQYNPGIWALPDRPTPAQKAEQKKHARRGADMLSSFAEDKPDLLDHSHFKIRHALTLYHHERFDGTGPEKMKAGNLPRFVQISCIIDAYDGDRIHRPHQPRRRTKKEALRRLECRDPSGRPDPNAKYAGAFHGGLVEEYIAMKRLQDKKTW